VSSILSDICPADAVQPVPAREKEMPALLCHNDYGNAPFTFELTRSFRLANMVPPVT
jgi:hypothetical protein